MLGTRCRIIQSLSVVRNVRFCSQLGREFAWTAPPGGETGISIYNFHTRSKLPLILSNEGNLKWYVCGPTVYDEPHIGHACCYVRFDVIRRILTNIFGINVVYMMNITNIDDKIIEKAKKVGQTTEQLSSHYESRFHQNMHRLNVLKPTVVHRVTDNIQSVIHFIQKLVESGHAYVTDQGSVFFRCDSYSSYGNLSRMKVLPSEKAVDYDQKMKPQDFVLWKPRKPGEPFWDSPWGEGRPGWHIGCSVLASKVFGENIDIHSGGSDLIFPHHENELAQSNCYHHTNQWVNYWIHSGLLSKEGDNEKMSKSLGNIITIPDLLKKYTSNQFRMFCLLTPYAMGESLGFCCSCCSHPLFCAALVVVHCHCGTL
ncbi:hypothetical protein EB796_010728 [Bugula neritina]|uniref:cysteine--tRNA ligase n=1 Tax=Bugula neritina TaxID=10212 RepID=A0A7J7JZ48_BUGNE|nr:hypothetical protein EB796_010728 [Bugula neritina]